MTSLTDRDDTLLRVLLAFKFATTPQLRVLVFGSNRSGTPCDRALKRLIDAGLIKRVGRRAFGSNMTGAVPIIYALSTRGRRMVGGKDSSPVQSGLGDGAKVVILSIALVMFLSTL